ncbi:DUF6241 domain-containing protein [Sediminibacillus massiliensis]|uniref:DUF6241 domain-containing protein n=1 Tax=Sediminibacillus massiliensis TaxID=1926277 RepID=UPI0009884767|nr:DUF6241 domain-containing protein [Sediminibacillus massiliensis]
MYKWLVAISAIILLIVIGWGTYSWNANGDTAQNNNTRTEEQAEDGEQGVEEQREAAGQIAEEDLQQYEEEGLNPFGHDENNQELTDGDYQEYIHGMSHQKIEAKEKWGFYEIHPQRIQWLLDGLEEVELEHEKLYKRILEKWENGNFSSVDEDHNAIWELQGGTIGRATGVLSPEEEQEYINKNSD